MDTGVAIFPTRGSVAPAALGRRAPGSRWAVQLRISAGAGVLAHYDDAGFRRAIHLLPSAGSGPLEWASGDVEAVAEVRGQ